MPSDELNAQVDHRSVLWQDCMRPQSAGVLSADGNGHELRPGDDGGLLVLSRRRPRDVLGVSQRNSERESKMTPRYRGKHLELGVAAHAYMCASATLTPAQLELLDQTMVYAAAAGLDTVTVIGDAHIDEPCKYLGMDCGGVGRDVIVVHGDDLLEHSMLKMEPSGLKLLSMLKEAEPAAVVPRKGTRKRDWEQRNRKQKRR
jgi:hypothetical protein